VRKFEGVSESQAQYTPKEAVRDMDTTGPEGPSDRWWEKTKFSGESEAHGQYTPKALERYDSQSTKIQPPVRPNAKFEGVTESRSAFTPKQRDPNDVFGPGDEPTGDPWWKKTTFRGESESQAAYTPKPVEPRADLRVEQKAPTRQQLKFDGTSESKAQFTPKEAVRDIDTTGPEGPSERWWEKTKFTGQSESKGQYTPKSIERYDSQSTKIQRPERSNVKFEGITESQAAFQPKVADRSDMRDQGEQGEPWWEKTKFQGTSEHHAQFTPKELEPRQDLRLDAGKMKVHRAMVHLEPSLGQVRDSQDSSAHGALK